MNGNDTSRQTPQGSDSPKQQPPPRDPCDCELEIIPFDCKRGTCNCPDEVRSEACGIRSDNDGQDEVKIGYRAKANGASGAIFVKRTHPDARDVSSGSLNCGGKCDLLRACVVAFEVQAVERPSIQQGIRSLNKLGDLLVSEKPKLRPFTNREQYAVTLKCDDKCTKTAKVTVYDGDLIKLCYNFGYNSVTSLGPDRLTMRQYCAALGENGARALVEKYYASVTSCRREFRDPCWSACLSASLAEEFYKAYVEDDYSDPLWDAFFSLPDFELTGRGAGYTRVNFRGDLFAKAHLRSGLRKAIERCGTSPCCAQDLGLIAETLVKAQKSLLRSLKTDPRLSLDIASVFGIRPIREFRKQLRAQMLQALEDKRAYKCLEDLRVVFAEQDEDQKDGL
jgi:hypothetical protein